ncbi:MAG: PorV/PorQ family protein [Melioribacteraceae bacterium]|nr:PorV/PorQ family protein [Melioribacteraceae bacterium]
MKHRYILKLGLFLLIVSLSELFAGGGNRIGTSGASQLLIPVGARGIALGGANLATTRGVDAIFWNPAGIAKTQHGVDVTFSHMNHIADIGIEYGAIAARINSLGVFSFHVKSVDMGDIPVTTTAEVDGTGRTYAPQLLTAGISFSRQLTDAIAVGITGNFISETIQDVSATGVAFNVGVIYDNPGGVEGLSFGIAMKNLGPQMRFDGSGLLVTADVDDYNRPPQLYQAKAASFELPSTFEFGLSYSREIDDQNSFLATGSFKHNNFQADEYLGGLEYNYNQIFFLRGGYTSAANIESDDYLYGFTGGFGISYLVGAVTIRADYAFREVEYFDANHVFALSLGF